MPEQKDTLPIAGMLSELCCQMTASLRSILHHDHPVWALGVALQAQGYPVKVVSVSSLAGLDSLTGDELVLYKRQDDLGIEHAGTLYGLEAGERGVAMDIEQLRAKSMEALNRQVATLGEDIFKRQQTVEYDAPKGPWFIELPTVSAIAQAIVLKAHTDLAAGEAAHRPRPRI